MWPRTATVPSSSERSTRRRSLGSRYAKFPHAENGATTPSLQTASGSRLDLPASSFSFFMAFVVFRVRRSRSLTSLGPTESKIAGGGCRLGIVCESRINALPYPFGSTTESKIRCVGIVCESRINLNKCSPLRRPFGFRLWVNHGSRAKITGAPVARGGAI